MPERKSSPFAAYLRQIDARLADLPPDRRAAIRRELLAHLQDAAAEQGASPDDADFQAAVIAQLGPGRDVAAAFGAVHGGLYRLFARAGFAAGVCGGLLGLPGAVLAIGLTGYFGLAGLLMTLALVVSAALGLAGTILRSQGRRAGWRLVLGSGLVLATSGALLLHSPLSHEYDLLAGAGLLFGGTLLLVNAAVHPAVPTLPRPQKALLTVAVALLVSFVPPFSYLPNPLGAYYLLAGGYRYDPRLPFVNGFATLTAADPAPVIAARLDRLIGQTGLDPLDPRQPLAGYTMVGVSPNLFRGDTTADVEMRYADGNTRRFTIPVQQYGRTTYTGIDPLLAEHLPLPYLPFASPDASIRIGVPAPLPFDDAANRTVMQMTSSGGPARWSPDGRRFLVSMGTLDTPDQRRLWLISLDGALPRELADNAEHYDWSGDGRYVVYQQYNGVVVALDLESGARQELPLIADGPFAVHGADVYFVSGGRALRHSLGGAPDQPVPLPEASSAPAFTPDSSRAAYLCGSDLCLADASGGLLAHIDLGYAPPHIEPARPAVQQPDARPGPMPTSPPANMIPYEKRLETFEIAWSADGQRLALATGGYSSTGDRVIPQLRIVNRDGRVERAIPIGPDGQMFRPQWTQDGRFVVINTFPAGGRRIVTVEAATGSVSDLSQPRWDAFASLSPNGNLLLWNGRGGFWGAPLIVRNHAQ